MKTTIRALPLVVALILTGALPCAASITGLVADGDGVPVPGASVVFTDVGRSEDFSAVTGDDGRYVIDLSAAGVDKGKVPERFILGRNYPNPFNPETTIPFTLPAPGNVDLIVYNVLGQAVRTLVSGTYPAGTHHVRWDRRADDGTSAAAGVYLYRLRVNGVAAVGKMLLLDGGVLPGSALAAGVTGGIVPVAEKRAADGSPGLYTVRITAEGIEDFVWEEYEAADGGTHDFTVIRYGRGNPYGGWENGLPVTSDYFPIAVWLQSPFKAPAYSRAGVNLFIGLWQGPTEQQLADLTEHGMQVICDQNAVGLAHRDDPIIVGWMHGDEPDNAQSDGQGGYDPPILPEVIQEEYRAIVDADPSRPVMLNLGQGVAYDGWVGRGVRTNHPEDYPEYIEGSDIVSFDIYPVTHSSDTVKGNLWYVPYGVSRLRDWSDGEEVVWNCIETTHINATVKPTPAEVRAEVWMSLIAGSKGIIYFCHEWYPAFKEWALLDDPEMLEAVTAINTRIHSLAPVLNSPTVADGASVVSSDETVPISVMVKRYRGATYLFAACMRRTAVTGSFTVNGLDGDVRAEVLDEDRAIPVSGGTFSDGFEPYGVHLYRIR